MFPDFPFSGQKKHTKVDADYNIVIWPRGLVWRNLCVVTFTHVHRVRESVYKTENRVYLEFFSIFSLIVLFCVFICVCVCVGELCQSEIERERAQTMTILKDRFNIFGRVHSFASVR